MFVNNLDGQAIYIAGKFKRSQYEDAYDDFVSRYGKPDDRLGDPGDQRSIWFLKNGVAVMRERAAKIGEGSAAFSLFCFDGGNERVAKELNADRSAEHTSELQSLMRISYAVFCLKKKKNNNSIKKDKTLT